MIKTAAPERRRRFRFYTEDQMLKRAIVLLALAVAAGLTTSHAQAAQKIVSFSICAGSDCHNNASQHNFTHRGVIKVPTGLPEATQVRSLAYGCAAFCSHAAVPRSS